MRKASATIAVLTLVVSILSGDVVVKQKTHTDAYYYGGVERSARDTAESLWIGNGKIAYVTENRRIVVDDTAKKVIIIFPTQKTYAESPLPLDMKNLTDEESWNRLQNYQTRGKVETTDQHRRIGRWDCRAFKVTVDVPTPLEITYWATEDLPFDWRKAAALALPIRKLANYSDEYIEALSLIQGHPVLIETTIFISGSSFGSVSKVAEISESSAPDDIFAIPEGFEKKERLSILDLRIR